MWTTYGLHCVLKALYTQTMQPLLVDMGRPLFSRKNYDFSSLCYSTSLSAALERSLSAAFSGAREAFIRSAMDKLWLSAGFFLNGVPSLNPSVVGLKKLAGRADVPFRIIIEAKRWPSDRQGRPILMYERTLSAHYTMGFAEASFNSMVDESKSSHPYSLSRLGIVFFITPEHPTLGLLQGSRTNKKIARLSLLVKSSRPSKRTL